METAGVPNVALWRPDSGADAVGAGAAVDDFISFGDGEIRAAGGVAIPRIRAVEVPIPVAGGLGLQIEPPSLRGVGSDSPAHIVHRVVGFEIVGVDHTIRRGNEDGPGPKVGVLAIARVVFTPFVVVGGAAVDADPRAGLDVNRVVRGNGIQLEVILHGGVFEIRIRTRHVKKVAVLAVVGVGIEHPEIVAVAVAEDEHRALGVIVHGDIRAPNILGLEGAIAAARVFVALVASGGDGDDFFDIRAGWVARRVDVLDEARLVSPWC